MIEQVLPSGVAWAETLDDPPEAELLPAEHAAVVRAVDRRRREFTTGRHCARQALARLGVGPVAILPGPAGEPGWPEGVVGSITHCAGYRAAVVARAADRPAVGIDAEPHEPLPAGVLDAVARPEERAQLDRLAAATPTTAWDRLLFCAKEATYKAWYPLGRRMLDFDDATVTLDPGGTLTVRLLVTVPVPVVAGHGELRGLAGRWTVGDGLVLAAVTELR
jgi:4'-phosphopantetheinyl transferase EntD